MQKGFVKLFDKLNIGHNFLLELAIKTEFIKRNREITPSAFLHLTCLEASKGIASLNDLASSFNADYNIAVSKQAIWKKMTVACQTFFEKVLAEVMSKKLEEGLIKIPFNRCKYKRILVQDSTIIKLPQKLFDIYSGVSNGHSQVCNARVQATYNLLSGEFVSFSIDPYSKNDLKSAPETILQDGDLCLRDRGYLTNNEIQRHITSGADCIYRYKYGAIMLDSKTEEVIDLFGKLKRKKSLDMMVKLNNAEKTIVRLIATPINEEIANKRRMKAKKENKTPPTKAYLESLAWSIFILTIPKEEASPKVIFDIYSLRWRIEIIFKSWKSNLNFDKIHNVSKNQLNILLLARFLMIIVCTQYIYFPCNLLVKQEFNKNLSLLKVIKYLNRHWDKIHEIIEAVFDNSNSTIKPIDSLAKYCSYDKRKREDFEQLMNKIFA